jgi:hypothetical protein
MKVVAPGWGFQAVGREFAGELEQNTGVFKNRNSVLELQGFRSGWVVFLGLIFWPEFCSNWDRSGLARTHSDQGDQDQGARVATPQRSSAVNQMKEAT